MVVEEVVVVVVVADVVVDVVVTVVDVDVIVVVTVVGGVVTGEEPVRGSVVGVVGLSPPWRKRYMEPAAKEKTRMTDRVRSNIDKSFLVDIV